MCFVHVHHTGFYVLSNNIIPNGLTLASQEFYVPHIKGRFMMPSSDNYSLVTIATTHGRPVFENVTEKEIAALCYCTHKKCPVGMGYFNQNKCKCYENCDIEYLVDMAFYSFLPSLGMFFPIRKTIEQSIGSVINPPHRSGSVIVATCNLDKHILAVAKTGMIYRIAYDKYTVKDTIQLDAQEKHPGIGKPIYAGSCHSELLVYVVTSTGSILMIVSRGPEMLSTIIREEDPNNSVKEVLSTVDTVAVLFHDSKLKLYNTIKRTETVCEGVITIGGYKP